MKATRAALVCGLLALWGAAPNPRQVSAPAAPAAEREELLFVLNPAPARRLQRAVDVLWIPGPVQPYCLGRTREECAAIDYCIRTTDRNVSQCRNLGVDVTRAPQYPSDLYPRRVLAVTYFRTSVSAITGLGKLFGFIDGRPKADFDRLSLRARVKARIRVKRSADDDDFEVLEILAAPLL